LTERLELLAETPSEPSFPLPPALAERYPGTVGFPDEWLYANFVESLDGVVALPGVARANRLIADASDADHFVMALLRACASVVLIGSGTLRASPSSRWLPESVYPRAADALAELRTALGLEPQPALAVVTTGTGPLALPPGLARRPIVLTTTSGAARLTGLAADVVAVSGDGAVDARAAVAALRERGHARILCEGGPTFFGSLLRAGLVDELFLTVSPVLAGRAPGARTTLGLVEDDAFLPDTRIAAELAGVRRCAAHLFLRYRFEAAVR